MIEDYHADADTSRRSPRASARRGRPGITCSFPSTASRAVTPTRATLTAIAARRRRGSSRTRLALPAERWSVAFQSRVGGARWLGPYTEDRLRELAGDGVKRIAVACPGFAVDCLETLEEIAIRGAATFLAAGGLDFEYIPALNDDAAQVECLARLVAERAVARGRDAMIGRFHEVSVHAPDLLASLAFYERLGFTQVTTGEAWTYPYAVVADARLAIGLHGRELAAIAAARFRAAGSVRASRRARAAGHRRSSIADSATTCSTRRASKSRANRSGCSRRARIRRRSRRRAKPRGSAGSRNTRCRSPTSKQAEQDWERLGFVPAEEGDEPYPHIGLTSDR